MMMFWTLYLPITALLVILFFDNIDAIFRGKKKVFKIESENTLKASSRELKLTWQSLILFAAVGAGMDWFSSMGYGMLYSNYNFGLLETIYLIASFFIALGMHDVYFYATHWLLHSKLFFKSVHYVHHKSHSSNAWSSFAFHPVEGLFQVGIIPLVFFILPMHEYAFVLFGFQMMLISVYGHCGYELRPNKRPLFSMLNTSLHHYQHHQFVRFNFGLYLNTWDKLFHSNYPKYEEAFEALKNRINNSNRER